MPTARIDPATGRLILGDDEEGNPIVVNPDEPQIEAAPPRFGVNEDNPNLPPVGLSYSERRAWGRDQEQSLAEKARLEEAALKSQPGYKDLISWKTIDDVGKAIPNALVAFGTDLVDLAAGAQDLGRETHRVLTSDHEWNEGGDVFNDADNPLTQARREMFPMETHAGDMVDISFRIAAGAMLGKMAWNWPIFSKNLGTFGATVGKITKLNKAYRSAKVADNLTDLASIYQKGKKVKDVGNAYRAANIARKNAYLNLTLQQVAKVDDAADVASWMNNVRKGVGAYTKSKFTPRNIAETLAWDAFMSFNIFGEGDDLQDETIFDGLEDLGVNMPGNLTSSTDDTSLDRKAKGILDGTLIGVVGGGLVDLVRIKRFQRAYKGASKANKAKILKAFSEQADELGKGAAVVGEYAIKGSNTRFPLGGRYRSYDVKARGTEGLGGEIVPTRGPAPDSTYRGGGAGRVEGLGPQSRKTGFRRQRSAPDGSDSSTNLWDTKGELATGQSTALDSYAEGGQLNLGSALARVDQARLEDTRWDQSFARGVVDAIKPVDVREVSSKALPGQGALPGGLAPTLKPGPRRPTPTISPGGIRRAVEQAVLEGVSPVEIRAQVRRMLPQKRVDMLDYIDMFKPRLNEFGRMNAADQIWADQINGQALAQGWAVLDPRTGELRFIRARAVELDAGDLVQKQAADIDRIEQLRTLEASPTVEPEGKAVDPEVLPPESENLLQKKARVDGELESLRRQGGIEKRGEVINPEVLPPEKVSLADQMRATIEELRQSDSRLQALVDKYGARDAAEELRLERGIAEEESLGRGKGADVTGLVRITTYPDNNPIQELFNLPVYEISVKPLKGLSDDELATVGLSRGDLDGMSNRKQMGFLKEHFDQVRAELPTGAYRVWGDTPSRKDIYFRWFKDDPDVSWVVDGEVVKVKNKEATPYLIVKRDQPALKDGEDPAIRGAETEAITAKLEEQQLLDQEIGRLANEVTAEDPDQLVSEMLDINPDEYRATVVNAFTGRGWEVYSPEGEMLGSFQTKRAAQKAADKETAGLRDVLTRRAQQAFDDEAGLDMPIGGYDSVRDSELMGKFALSPRQIELINADPLLRDIMGEIPAGRKTFELTQGEMSMLSQAANEILDEDLIKGAQKKVLRNLIEKLETNIELIEPQARIKRTADRILSESARLYNHGDYC